MIVASFFVTNKRITISQGSHMLRKHKDLLMCCVLCWRRTKTNTVRWALLQAGLRKAGPVDANELQKSISICKCFWGYGILCGLMGSLWGHFLCNVGVPLWGSSDVHLGYRWDPSRVPPRVHILSSGTLLWSLCGPSGVLVSFFCILL